MPHPTGALKRSKAQIMEDINRKLPALPRAQQNLVASYAQGICEGLSLQTKLMTEYETPPAKHGDAP